MATGNEMQSDSKSKKRRHYNQWMRSAHSKVPKQTRHYWRGCGADSDSDKKWDNLDTGHSISNSVPQVNVQKENFLPATPLSLSNILADHDVSNDLEAAIESDTVTTDECGYPAAGDLEMDFVDLEELKIEMASEDDDDLSGGESKAAPDDHQSNQTNAASESDSTEHDKPIYSGARITLATSVLLIITFVMRHGLSSVALVDLLSLVEIHCLSDNICHTTLRLFRKYFDQNKVPIEKHYCCLKCKQYLGIDLASCNKCKMRAEYFMTTPLKSVLQNFFAREDFLEHLKYPLKRKKLHENNIEDVFDGRLYKERFDNGFFVGTPESAKKSEIHISFQLNTDGVALFKSSKSSLWPIFLVINELHPRLRFSREYRILLGMWFGSKPDFNIFLQPFAKMLTDLYKTGVQVKLYNGTYRTVRGVLLSAVFDSPARCLFQNFIQFNGKHGCPYCTADGRSVRVSEMGSTQTYPFNNEANNKTGHAAERTHEETVQHANTADETNTIVQGVKGASPFLYVPTFDMIRCTLPDYMHGVCLGLSKLFVFLWFDVSNRSEVYSIRKLIKTVDNRIANIKPPNLISRVPQKIETHIKWWKASEYRSFLLYYSIPCLYGILPSDYFEHLLLLVNSIHILLSKSISMKDLEKARCMLKMFCYKIGILYKARYYTWNMHSILHYCKAVEDAGPLFLCSCFWYEDFNGDLRKLFHGTNGVETQILTSLAITQQIPKLASKLRYGTLEYDLFTHMNNKSKALRTKITECISESIYVIGAFCQSNQFSEQVQLFLGQVPEKQQTFKRLMLFGEIIQCKHYDVVTKRNSFTVSYNVDNSKIHYGQVLSFVKCYKKCANPVFCNDECTCHTPDYLAVVDELRLVSSHRYCDEKILNKTTVKKVVPVQRVSHGVQAIPVASITSLCVWMDVGLDVAFLGIIPNHFEKD